ncbi:MAG: ATP-binding cassette domain-containing protein [Acidimicrobiia bacterium]
MPSIHLDCVSFSYTSAVDVLVDVDLHLGPGWTGVVGANGEGKTTLLSLLSGELVPTTGTVTVDAAGLVLCGQNVDRPEPHVLALAESFEPGAFALRGRLGLDPDMLDRWATLSPGERRRWQIGGALHAQPDVLLLDEPTNHLDADARQRMLTALARFPGVGLVVSHDRDLLDRLTSGTVRFRSGHADHLAAPYTVAAAEWAARDLELAEAHADAKRRVVAADRRLADQRRDLEQRSARFTRTMQQAKAKDHDLHSTARKVKAQQGASAAGRSIGRLAAERDRLVEAAAGFDPTSRLGGSISFAGGPAPRPTLIRFSGPLVAGDVVLIDHLDLVIERTTRLHVAGPNGAGKSTLLAALAAAWDLDPERLLHLPQEYDDAGRHQVVEALMSLPKPDRGRVLQLVGRLGTDPDVLLASEQPSPGETRKLVMAMGLARHAWCLLLDEPTNHLDLQAVERLESALTEYPGSVVVVSHDSRFADAVAGQRVILSPG